MTEFRGSSRRRRRTAFLVGASSVVVVMTAVPAFARTAANLVDTYTAPEITGSGARTGRL